MQWASWPLIVTTWVIIVFGAWLPFSPIGPAFGFTQLPLLYWPLLAGTLLGYVLLTQVVKTWLYRKSWVSEQRPSWKSDLSPGIQCRLMVTHKPVIAAFDRRLTACKNPACRI